MNLVYIINKESSLSNHWDDILKLLKQQSYVFY